jgi:uncharacterized protein (TIGR02271 family)
MSTINTFPIVTRDGAQGTAELLESGRYSVRLDDGRQFEVDAELLTCREDNSFYFSHSADEVIARQHAGESQAEQVIPVVEEQAHIERREVETGRVLVRKTAREYEEVIDEPIFEEQVEIERVPINEFVDTAPLIREEGDAIVIPLVEEVLVVEKRLKLREEVRVVRHRRETQQPQPVKLRREDVEIEHVGPE